MTNAGKGEKELVLRGTRLKVKSSTDVLETDINLSATVAVQAEGMNYDGKLLLGEDLHKMFNVVATTVRDDDLAKMEVPQQFATRKGMQCVCETLAATAAEAVAAGQNPQVVGDALYALKGGDFSISPVRDKAIERNAIVDAFKNALRALIS